MFALWCFDLSESLVPLTRAAVAAMALARVASDYSPIPALERCRQSIRADCDH